MKKLAWLLLLTIIGFAILAITKPELISRLRDSAGIPASSIVYKWQDSEGNWHVTGTPPPTGTPYETQEYLHDTNIVPALPEEKDN
jgi:hypothetical protein